MKSIKKIIISIFFATIFFTQAPSSFAQTVTPSFYTITATPTDTSVSYTVSYSGDVKGIATTVQTSCARGGGTQQSSFYKEENYNADKGVTFSKTYSSDLVANDTCSIFVYSVAPETVATPTKYTQKLNFVTKAVVAPPPNPNQYETPNECNDKKDNDGDGKIDKLDLQCKDGVLCEDGTTKCVSFVNTSNPSTTGSGFALNVQIKNPLKVGTVQGAIKLFMDAVLKIAIPLIVVFFIWSGLSFVLARGNPEKIKTAKNMFWYTIIGTLLILGAWTITNAIIGTVNSITG